MDNFDDRIENFISQNESFSIYMASGGTSFGLTAGSFDLKDKKAIQSHFKPVITSYDNGAPLNEAGRPSKNFHIFRSLMDNHTSKKLPSIPSWR